MTTPTTETTNTPRRRARRIETAPAVGIASAEVLLLRAWEAKVAAQEASEAFDKAKDALHEAMRATGKTLVELAPHGNRPAITAKETSRTINTIDPAAFEKLVDRKAFLKCVSVSVTEAKKVATENALAKITAEKPGKPYLDIRAKGLSKP